MADIDASTVLLDQTIPALTEPEHGWAKDSDSCLTDHDNNGVMELMVKFDRAQVSDHVAIGDAVELTLTGEVAGSSFEGSDTIRVIDEGRADAPGQNKECGDSADGKAMGRDDAPGLNKERGGSADGKATGRDDAPGLNKERGGNADGKATGRDDAPVQNKERGDSADGKATGRDVQQSPGR